MTVPGPTDSLLDVAGLSVGHWQRLDPEVTVGTPEIPGTGAATGCTVVLADPSAVVDAASLRSAAEDLGAELVVSPVAVTGNPGVHDPLRLAAALRDVIG